MKLSRSAKAVAAAATIAALAVPAVASAHPGVYTVTAKVATGPTYVGGDTTGASLTNQTQYAIANDGYPLGLTENNAITGVQPNGTAGMINYKAMPGTWRAGMTPEQKRTYAGAQTDVQPHATCAGPNAGALNGLDDGATILAWQSADPFYNYIPWQKAAVGLGDDPSKWIPVVKAATDGLPGAPAGGVDLGAIATVDPTKGVNDPVNTAPFKAACEAIGGTYNKADTNANIAAALVADTKAPLQAQIDVLGSQVTALMGENTTLGAAKAAALAATTTADANLAAARTALAAAEGEARTARAAAAQAEAALKQATTRPLAVSLAGKKLVGGSGAVLVTGTAGTAVTVTVALTKRAASALGVASRSVDSAKATIGASGAAIVAISPTAGVAKALKKRPGRFPVAVAVAGGGQTATSTASIAR